MVLLPKQLYINNVSFTKVTLLKKIVENGIVFHFASVFNIWAKRAGCSNLLCIQSAVTFWLKNM